MLTLELLDTPGEEKCRWCGGPIPPRNIVYCSQECCNKTYEKYLWEKVKTAVWLRDNRTCRECGTVLAKKSQYGYFIEIIPHECHHIRTFLQLLRDVGTGFRGNHREYKRALLEAYMDKDNLITLCLECHGKQDHPRFAEKKDHLENRYCILEWPWSEEHPGPATTDLNSLKGHGQFWDIILNPPPMPTTLEMFTT